MVAQSAAVAVGLVLSACGRIDFDRVADHDAISADGIALGCLPPTSTPGSSCTGLPATCGASGVDSCCSSPPVCGGSFYRAFDVASDGAYIDTTHPATVSTFRLDRYEATVARFRQFVAAGMGTSANPPPNDAGARTLNGMPDQAGWDPSWNVNLTADTAALENALIICTPLATWTDTPANNESLPINCMTWFEAMAFCVWDGGFLPTEAELMYAASAGPLQRAYPWSTPPSSAAYDCAHANVGGLSGPASCVGTTNAVGSESPAGDGAWGHADLAGNVWEWALDWSAPTMVEPCSDCANFLPTNMRVFRGGGFNVGADYSRAAARYLDAADDVTTFRHPAAGVRCARPAE